jgi:hypothetical protein
VRRLGSTVRNEIAWSTEVLESAGLMHILERCGTCIGSMSASLSPSNGGEESRMPASTCATSWLAISGSGRLTLRDRGPTPVLRRISASYSWPGANGSRPKYPPKCRPWSAGVRVLTAFACSCSDCSISRRCSSRAASQSRCPLLRRDQAGRTRVGRKRTG